uniref:RxLR effector candidate protein n=1 Tax=Hyaloperonospora arabidopsidis (strain Emoy2) TaxID=559515 RepID=M4BU28_HYAAE
MRARPMTINACMDSPEQKPAARPPLSCVPEVTESMFAPPLGQTLLDQRGQDQDPTAATEPRRGTVAAPAYQAHAAAALSATPIASQQKLSIRKFNGTELYKGLGSGFFDWGRTFLRAVNLAEASCVFTWSEEAKVNLLGHHLSGTAERYFHKQVNQWWNQRPMTTSCVGCSQRSRR